MSIFSFCKKENVEKKPEVVVKPIRYGSKVELTDPFYMGCKGEVIDYLFKDERLVTAWSSCGSYYENVKMKYYKVKLEGTNEEITVHAGGVSSLET